MDGRTSREATTAPARRVLRSRWPAALVLAGVLACMAPTGANAASSLPATTHIAWTTCSDAGEPLQCARVRVPLDWSHPHGATISLAVVRWPAGGPGRRIGSMFFNPGGPGDSGVQALSDPAEASVLDAAGGGRFDIISWDPRGSNSSAPVTCFTSASSQAAFWGDVPFPTTRSASLSYLTKVRGYGRRCRKHAGSLLAHVSTADTARDMDRLRHLAGDRQLTFYGWSYGTFLGETYANLFPKRVRAMALDSVIDPRVNVTSIEAVAGNGVSGSDAVFRKFKATCDRAGAPACSLVGHGTSATTRVNDLIERLQRGPIPAPEVGPTAQLTLADVQLVLFQVLAQPQGWPEIAAHLELAAEGDGSALLADTSQCDFACLLGGLTSAQAIMCADATAQHTDRAWPSVIGRLQKISPLRGAVLGWFLWAPCTALHSRDPGRYTGPWTARTKHPVLVVGTRWDPNTPYKNARSVAGLLGNAVLLTHDGYGHISGSDPSTCVQRATTSYFVTLRAPSRGTVCPSDRQPFDPKFGTPAS